MPPKPNSCTGWPDAVDEDSYAVLADRMVRGIEQSELLWYKPDGDLNYSYKPDGTLFRTGLSVFDLQRPA